MEAPKENALTLASRSDLQLGRRAFHCLTGILGATFYNFFLTHSQAVYILGAAISIVYLFEQIRIKYPELSEPMQSISQALMRAEERLKESAMLPYAAGMLLAILTFPKPAAVIAIYTMGISDPLSAIVGITWGRRPIAGRKTLEGSLAFFIATFTIAIAVLTNHQIGLNADIFWVSLFVGLSASAMELIPLRLDDNLTIPIYTAGLTWLFAILFEVPI